MLVRLSLAALALSLFSACGPQHSGSRPISPLAGGDNTTGFERESEGGRTVYTIAGNPEVYRELKESFSGKSPALARSIEKVEVHKLANNSLQVKVIFDGRYFGLNEVAFRGNLTQVGQEKKGIFTGPEVDPETYRPQFSLDVRCRSLDCQMMEMKLEEKTGQYYRAEALWIYQERETTARFIESERGGVTDLNVDPQETISTQTSVVIVEGPSYSEVVVRGRSTPQTEQPLLVVTTDLVDTQEQATVVTSVRVRGRSQDLSASLEGNDPNTGDLMLNVEDGSGSVRVIVESPQAENRGPMRIFLEERPKILDPSGIAEEIDAYTTKLNSYANNPDVLQRVDLWLQGGRACSGCRQLSRSSAESFLTNLQAVVPTLLEASRATGVSPEKAYMLAIESNFLKSNDFPIQVYNGRENSSAAGPWMITNRTGREILRIADLDFQIMPLMGSRPNRRLNSQDSRNYFYESTIMAFSYFQSFPEEIRHDPGLELAGYYQGPYGMEDLVNRHGGSNVSFRDLTRFNSFTNAKDTADYVYSIIALRFIGMNPEVHQLNVPELSEVPAALIPKLRQRE